MKKLILFLAIAFTWSLNAMEIEQKMPKRKISVTYVGNPNTGTAKTEYIEQDPNLSPDAIQSNSETISALALKQVMGKENIEARTLFERYVKKDLPTQSMERKISLDSDLRDAMEESKNHRITLNNANEIFLQFTRENPSPKILPQVPQPLPLPKIPQPKFSFYNKYRPHLFFGSFLTGLIGWGLYKNWFGNFNLKNI